MRNRRCFYAVVAFNIFGIHKLHSPKWTISDLKIFHSSDNLYKKHLLTNSGMQVFFELSQEDFLKNKFEIAPLIMILGFSSVQRIRKETYYIPF